METMIRPSHIESSPPRRHDHRVSKVTHDLTRLQALDRMVVDEHDATLAVRVVCATFQVPEPRLKFHGGRSMFTGATERPRHYWVETLGEDEVVRRERNGWGALPVDGAIRLGRETTLMTVAHELGHHLVFHLDPTATPPHGNRWVTRFDDSASVISRLIDV
ncbi:MAG: hypothetical protein ACR2N2_06030 [Acidimicrobiia bacterium]